MSVIASDRRERGNLHEFKIGPTQGLCWIRGDCFVAYAPRNDKGVASDQRGSLKVQACLHFGVRRPGCALFRAVLAAQINLRRELVAVDKTALLNTKRFLLPLVVEMTGGRVRSGKWEVMWSAQTWLRSSQNRGEGRAVETH